MEVRVEVPPYCKYINTYKYKYIYIYIDVYIYITYA